MGERKRITDCIMLGFFVAIAISAAFAQANKYEYRVLATTKTSTMEKEMNEAGEAGFTFAAVMGGETAAGGNEVVAVMIKDPARSASGRRIYKLLATSKTSTMQKELQQLGSEGFEYRGQTIFNSTFGGQEVAVIMELDTSRAAMKLQYSLLATSRTSTMQKELRAAGDNGFRVVGMTVAKTAFGGNELLCIMQKEER